MLAVTLRLLEEHGYDRLTLDAVATEAKASKATMYQRWPSKAELVLAAFAEGCRQVAVHPQTGTLHGDLMQLAIDIREQMARLASAYRAMLVVTAHDPAFNAAMQWGLVHHCKALIHEILWEAVDRGEIDASVISDELWDLLPGYLIFRTVMPSRPPTQETVQVLVDEVIIPSLTRKTYV